MLNKQTINDMIYKTNETVRIPIILQQGTLCQLISFFSTLGRLSYSYRWLHFDNLSFTRLIFRILSRYYYYYTFMSRFFSYFQSDGQQHARIMVDGVIRDTFFVACVFFKDTMKKIDKIHSKSVI